MRLRQAANEARQRQTDFRDLNEKLINLQSKIKTLTRDRHFTHDVKSMRLGVLHEKKTALTDEYRNLTDAFEYHRQYNVKLA